VFGVMGTDYNINNKYTDSLDQQIAANGGTGTVAHTEQTYELNYGVSLAPGIQLKPYAFYTVHPDQLVYGEVPSGHIKNAFGVGAQLFISFNYAFGLPSFSLND
jgi:carbohydrate-selective porin OprB